MNLLDRNKNDLSRYFYDLSKAVVISYIALPVFQRTLDLKLALAGSMATVVLLLIGMTLKKG